jgi:hypothetical protein
MIATSEGDTDIVELLLDRGADINLQNEKGFTALMHALINGDTEIVKLLIDRGADIDLQNMYGETALDIAITKGNQKIIDILRKAERAENIYKKLIATKAYVQSQRINSSSTENDPLIGFYHSNIDAPHDIMQQVLNIAHGEYEKENEGAEESKSNRGDAGGNKRRSVKRKSVRRKSVRRKSVKRKSVRRKSVRRKSIRRKVQKY